MEKSILELPLIYINGGKRGYLVSLSPQAVQTLLQAKLVEVGI
jgi:prolyl-tRNA editing enzyme YbaK/EbsC (Cys-tRNA(Pro) deacylase)